MSNSYRIRTKPGVDSSIKILIDQEFEYLEILSLKILQSQIYTRQCSDYGVIVGRVSVNNGFGIPNAKVSVFVPLDSMDENDPVISDLYPYKTLADLNEDGYRYNLLPYKRQHGGHNPTGTFFTREDVLINPSLIEVYDKYYKYNAVTNESGDYMIFGVPVGSQTVVVDIDLSDIGEFSLSPQDLIRMGVTTPAQVAGTYFKASTNLRELPQIITFNRTLEVEPLWGQPEICNLGITRTDFDLSGEANIDITPTAIFMGSLVSSKEEDYVKKSCKPTLTSGSLCSLVAGPGEILAIRQTSAQDSNGRPILETVDLESGGQVIDENGTWLVDVPMNLDYVITNEFGEQVISSDPKKGIPTRGKYRFKVKWNQSPSVSADPIKRGYFLVPNVKEYGWAINGSGKHIDPITGANGPATSANRDAAQRSYAFSLDWADYGKTGTTLGNQMIDDAIKCEDKFYEFQYNKVYTVSQLITQYRNGWGNWRVIAVKDILDTECSSDNNKFPTNDAVYRFDLIYFLFNIMLFIFRPILYSLLITMHILAFFLLIIGPVLAIIAAVVVLVAIVVCSIINAIIWVINILGSLDYIDCPDAGDIEDVVKKMLNLYKNFTNMKIPNLSYPDCEFCSCSDGGAIDTNAASYGPAVVSTQQTAEENGANAVLTVFELSANYNAISPYTTDNTVYENLFAGQSLGSATQANNPLTPSSRVPQLKKVNGGANNQGIESFEFTTSLTQAERLNLFNTKAKFFQPSANNPGGGVNRIKVSFNPADGVFHEDNVVAIMVQPNSASIFEAGNLITFQNPSNSTDPNMTGFTSLNEYGTASSTGTTVNNKPGSTSNVGNITVQYANYNNPNGPALVQTYTSQQDSDDVQYSKFPMDIEYFQVITATTYSDFSALCATGGNNPLGLQQRFINNEMKFNRIYSHDFSFGLWTNELNSGSPNTYPLLKPYLPPPLVGSPPNPGMFPSFAEQYVVFLVRGVDPYSTRSKCEYDLSILYGDTGFGRVKVSSGTNGPFFHLNQPIKPGFKNVRHNLTNNFDTDPYSGQKLYFDSFHYQPSTSVGAPFSGFSSNLQTYYSSLDNGGMSPALTGAPVLSLGFDSDVTYGLNVNGNNNWFAKEFITSVSGGYYNAPINNSTITRGYFNNEIIEGGSGMLCQVSIEQYLVANSVAGISYNGYYYSPKYPIANMTYNLGGSRKIIMRSDRLPTSTSVQNNLENSFLLHNNVNFGIFQFSDDGTAIQANTGADQSATLTGTTADSLSAGEPKIISSVIDSFNCGAMVNLACYEDDNGELKVNYTGDCRKDPVGGGDLVTNGCYTYVTTIFLSLPADLKLLTEWTSRLLITFAACRNVWGHMFTNNWINGTLYAFNFNNDVTFTSPLAPNPNQAQYAYCDDVVVLHNSTNNFYYRSSPWNESTNKFIGQNRATSGGLIGALFGQYGGNFYNLLYPTTVLDLGPRTDYLQEIVMSDEYDGYVMNKLQSTTFSDVSELLNLFIITRLANTNFLQGLMNGSNILSYFSRVKNMVDGDYAQAISVNSELGVAPFQSANYPDRPGQDSIYINTLSDADQIFGVFFQSDTRLRDFVSPKRTIIDDTVAATNVCAFSNIEVISQEVPFYQWSVNSNSNNDSIFGSQENGWRTDPINSGDEFFTKKYQSLDRIEPTSRYFRTNATSMTKYFKGYIYSVTPQTVNGTCSIVGNVLTITSVSSPLLQEGFILSGPGITPNTTILSQLTVVPSTAASGGNGTYRVDIPQTVGSTTFIANGFTYSASIGTQDLNSPQPRVINTGAPFHFYFGLKKGRTAFDRFVIKWVDTNNIIA